jgi:hypothetical protein
MKQSHPAEKFFRFMMTRVVDAHSGIVCTIPSA